ncbi:unnamed protein product [Timema podura]|uniref:Rab-GAP TBC domain-containing protein n=1 Tax=Timema podura TaxID=61482 RepID=A0ABN7NR26_TIMPD|nr:unnamed protein product [Timema podura]
MSEESAFLMLRHIMFRRGLRRQYLPDMVALQIQLYQLSRLLHDQHLDLYQHFDSHEVAPTLYAAPWILTIFASQFPLGFVTRVFDIVFLENTEAIFRVALSLLEEHKDGLLACESFEEIMEYLKNVLPAIDKTTLDKVMKQNSTCLLPLFLWDDTLFQHEPDWDQVPFGEQHHETVPQLEKFYEPGPTRGQKQEVKPGRPFKEQQQAPCLQPLSIKHPRQPLSMHLRERVFALDISKQLHEYEVEYHVLQEEISTAHVDSEELKCVNQQNQELSEHLKSDVVSSDQIADHSIRLQKPPNVSKIATRNIESLEITRATQLATINRQEAQIRSLELTVAVMGDFIGDLMERPDIDIPGDVRRIVSCLIAEEKRRNTLKKSTIPVNNGNNIRATDKKSTHVLKSSLSSPNFGFKKMPNMLLTNIKDHHQISPSNNNNVIINMKESSDTKPIVDVAKNIKTMIKSVENSDSNSDINKQTHDSSLVAFPRSKLKSSQSSYELCTTNKTDSENLSISNQIHPLDSCSDISFTYSGTTKLKTLRPMRPLARNPSSDSIKLDEGKYSSSDLPAKQPDIIKLSSS